MKKVRPKNKYDLILLTQGIQNRQHRDRETREGWRGRDGGYFLMDRKFLLGNNENVQNVLEIVMIVAKQCKCT